MIDIPRRSQGRRDGLGGGVLQLRHQDLTQMTFGSAATHRGVRARLPQEDASCRRPYQTLDQDRRGELIDIAIQLADDPPQLKVASAASTAARPSPVKFCHRMA